MRRDQLLVSELTRYFLSLLPVLVNLRHNLRRILIHETVAAHLVALQTREQVGLRRLLVSINHEIGRRRHLLLLLDHLSMVLLLVEVMHLLCVSLVHLDELRSRHVTGTLNRLLHDRDLLRLHLLAWLVKARRYSAIIVHHDGRQLRVVLQLVLQVYELLLVDVLSLARIRHRNVADLVDRGHWMRDGLLLELLDDLLKLRNPVKLLLHLLGLLVDALLCLAKCFSKLAIFVHDGLQALSHALVVKRELAFVHLEGGTAAYFDASLLGRCTDV